MERLTKKGFKWTSESIFRDIDRWSLAECLNKLSAYEDTGLAPEQIVELKERNTPKKVRYQNRHGEGYDYKNEDYYHCPSCGRRLRNKKHDPVCPRCAQLLDWRIDNARDTIQSKAVR